jgi:flagellar export protein FliJ
MKSFRFPLQRVLDWRALHLRRQEEKLGALQQKLALLQHRENALTAVQLKSELGLLGLPTIDGSDLQALAAFQLRIQRERASLQAGCAECEAQIAEQRKQLLKVRRDYRVLEKLKEKRWRTWIYLSDHEVENIAAESYTSTWLRSNAEP